MTEKSILCSMGRIFRSMDKVWQRVGASEEITLPEIQVDHDFIENCFQRLSEFQDKLEEYWNLQKKHCTLMQLISI